jgi:hypothetical protein
MWATYTIGCFSQNSGADILPYSKPKPMTGTGTSQSNARKQNFEIWTRMPMKMRLQGSDEKGKMKRNREHIMQSR